MNRTMQGILWVVDDPLSGVIVAAFAVQVGICILPRSGFLLEVGGRDFGRVGSVCPPPFAAADGPPGRMSEEPVLISKCR